MTVEQTDDRHTLTCYRILNERITGDEKPNPASSGFWCCGQRESFLH
jgi:hypothetical protein